MKEFRTFLEKYKYILLVVLFASILRLYRLSQFPPSLNWDEVSHGFNAYSILKTGKDEWGNAWPVIFRAYGDYKLPSYIYLTSISEMFLGLNEFSVRLASALAGIGTVLFSYLLATKLFDKKIGLITALLVAVEPWSFFLSRGAFEANLGQFFIILGIYLFLKGFEKRSLLAISALFFGLSLWTYNSDRVFVPLLLIGVLFVYRNFVAKLWNDNKKSLIIPVLIFAAFFVPAIYQLGFERSGSARYENVAIIDQGAINKIENSRATSNLHPLISRLAFNRVTHFTFQFGQNYVSHFSPNFLFFEGADNYQFNIQKKGLLYPAGLVFILFGIYYLFKNRNEKSSQLLFLWLLIAPIAASLTRESPHALRSITILPIPMVLTALGLWTMFGWLKKNGITKVVVFGLVVLVYIWFGLNYYKAYFNEYPKNYSQAWQYGYKEIAIYIKENYSKYDQIIITKRYGEPHEFILFYYPWDPEDYQSDPRLTRYGQSGWFWVDRFDKFYFVNDWDIPKVIGDPWFVESGAEILLGKKVLLITSPGNYPPNFRLLKTLYFLDNTPAFDILEKNENES